MYTIHIITNTQDMQHVYSAMRAYMRAHADISAVRIESTGGTASISQDELSDEVIQYFTDRMNQLFCPHCDIPLDYFNGIKDEGGYIPGQWYCNTCEYTRAD